MNRRRSIMLIAGVEAFGVGLATTLFAAEVIRPMSFALIVLVLGVVTAPLIILAIRKLPAE